MEERFEIEASMTEIETVPVASTGAMPEIAPALPEQARCWHVQHDCTATIVCIMFFMSLSNGLEACVYAWRRGSC